MRQSSNIRASWRTSVSTHSAWQAHNSISCGNEVRFKAICRTRGTIRHNLLYRPPARCRGHFMSAHRPMRGEHTHSEWQAREASAPPRLQRSPRENKISASKQCENFSLRRFGVRADMKWPLQHPRCFSKKTRHEQKHFLTKSHVFRF